MTESGAPAREFVEFALRLADAAGAVVRKYYRAALTIESKADATPVTIADREAEQVLRGMIRAAYPDHGIEGEEFPGERLDAEFVWWLDPIDGTKSFVVGRPLFGTLIGLTRAGRPVVGVIDQCILEERWLGVAGERSTWNGQPIRVRACPALEQAVLSATSPQMFTRTQRAAMARLEQAVRFPVYGGDCYAYGLLAMGFIDLIVEADLDVHDFMALVPVIEGAGGLVTDWQGAALTPASDGRIVAAGDPRVHERALKLLALTDD
jgi:inositol-phosphate phosphatase / L-galactose 1-phosphate phosphatase / histidinol-phosphatase